MKPADKQLLKDWDEYRRNLKSDTALDEDMSHAERMKHRKQLEGKPLKWMKFFFPMFASAEFADFHKKAVKRLLCNGEWFEVLSWARELAKSTIVMMVVLFLVLTGKKKNVILVSSSFDNAKDLLEPYRAQLDSNERIIAYYGEQKAFGNWEAGKFDTKSGARFRALGAKQNPRGTKKDQVRPDVILVDDFDTDEECKNETIVNEKYDWFEKALIPTRSISNELLVVWCGNIIAKHCCVLKAGEKADHWDIVNIRDENGNSTWPEKNTEELIDRALRFLSTKAINGEYYNNPVSEGDIFVEMKYGKVPPLSSFSFLVCYADPATSNKKLKEQKKRKRNKKSYKACILLGIQKGVVYVLKCFLAVDTHDEFVNWFYYMQEYIGDKTQVIYFIENNTLQDPFFEEVYVPKFKKKSEDTGRIVPIMPDTRDKPDKFLRISSNLEPLYKQGILVLNAEEKDDPHMKRLDEQFLLFNEDLNAPADGPDAVEGGFFIANLKMQQIGINSVFVGKYGKTNVY